MTRDKLKDRRNGVNLDLVFRRGRYVVGFGFSESLQVNEIFISSSRPGSDAEATARDAAILASLSLQHGVDFDALRASLTRDHEGGAASAIGAAMDVIAREIELMRAEAIEA